MNQCDAQQITPLMIACRNNDVKHVRLLKESKVYLDFQDTNGWCALHYAVYGKSEKSVRYLLQSGKSHFTKLMSSHVKFAHLDLTLDFSNVFRDV